MPDDTRPPPPWGWAPPPVATLPAPKPKNDHGKATQRERTLRHREKVKKEKEAARDQALSERAKSQPNFGVMQRQKRALRPNPGHWKPGQSGNPKGVQGATLYKEAQRIARDASPDAARRLIELMGDLDTRVAMLAADKIMERAWGKPKEYDPAADPENRVRIDVSRLTDAERGVLRQLIKIATTVGGQTHEDDPAE